MFRNRRLFLIFVGLCTVIGCDAQYDYFSKISSYLRSGGSKIADTVSSYYDEYSQTKTTADIRGAYDNAYSYVRSGGSKIADVASSYYDEYSQMKTATDIRDACDNAYSYVRSGGSKIADTVSSYYDEYSQTKTTADIRDAYDNAYSYVRLGSSKIADILSSYFNEYTLMTSKPNEPEEHDKPLKDRRKAEDRNDYCEKMLHKYRIMKEKEGRKEGRNGASSDISEEALSRRIVNMLLSRTHIKSNGSLFWGRVIFEATPSEFEALKDFGFGISTLREIAPILDNVIKTPKSLTKGTNDS